MSPLHATGQPMLRSNWETPLPRYLQIDTQKMPSKIIIDSFETNVPNTADPLQKPHTSEVMFSR